MITIYMVIVYEPVLRGNEDVFDAVFEVNYNEYNSVSICKVVE